MSQSKKEIPLQTTQHVRIDGNTGRQIPVTRNRRGVLCEDVCHHGLDTLRLLAGFKPSEWLKQYQEHLRDRLEGQDLPSDRRPHWIKFPGGRWEEQKGPIELDPKRLPARALWIARVNALTEPLSQGRRAAEMLWYLNELERRAFSDDDLWLVCQLLERNFDYQVGGKINQLAMSGFKVAERLKAGPRKKKQHTVEKREIIWRQTEAFWRKHPVYRNKARVAADHICELVNSEFKVRGLLSKSEKPLNAKTIADHIGAICRGKKTATG